jgi:catechol 2,3-dioxygenase-like lactoylglutathione lyase family enzyme
VIIGIDHVQLAMPPGAEDTARAFYTGRLGLVELPKPEPLRSRGGCWFVVDSRTQLHLGVEADFRPARKAHPALVVSDLVGFVSAGGLDARWDDDLPGRRHCYVDDPFGNRIELIDAG